MSKMFKCSAEEGRRGARMAKTGLVSQINPDAGRKRGSPAEGWIIKYAWYSTMFHSAQMSHSGGLWDSCEAPVSTCTHI